MPAKWKGPNNPPVICRCVSLELHAPEHADLLLPKLSADGLPNWSAARQLQSSGVAMPGGVLLGT